MNGDSPLPEKEAPFRGCLFLPEPLDSERGGSSPGFKPGTSSLLLKRSNQLSYEDVDCKYLMDTRIAGILIFNGLSEAKVDFGELAGIKNTCENP